MPESPEPVSLAWPDSKLSIGDVVKLGNHLYGHVQEVDEYGIVVHTISAKEALALGWVDAEIAR